MTSRVVTELGSDRWHQPLPLARFYLQALPDERQYLSKLVVISRRTSGIRLAILRSFRNRKGSPGETGVSVHERTATWAPQKKMDVQNYARMLQFCFPGPRRHIHGFWMVTSEHGSWIWVNRCNAEQLSRQCRSGPRRRPALQDVPISPVRMDIFTIRSPAYITFH